MYILRTTTTSILFLPNHNIWCCNNKKQKQIISSLRYLIILYSIFRKVLNCLWTNEKNTQGKHNSYFSVQIVHHLYNFGAITQPLTPQFLYFIHIDQKTFNSSRLVFMFISNAPYSLFITRKSFGLKEECSDMPQSLTIFGCWNTT